MGKPLCNEKIRWKLKSIGDNTTVGIMVQLGEQNYTLLKGDKLKAMEMMKDAKEWKVGVSSKLFVC